MKATAKQADRLPKAPRIKVEVTEEMIADARPRDSQHCMIADAVRASFPEAKAVSVDLATIRFSDRVRGVRYTYLTPRIAQLELLKFDRGVPTEPFTFQLKGAHVTKAGTRRSTRVIPDSTKKSYAENAKKGRKVMATNRDKLNKTHLVDREKSGAVLDRVGGRPAPLQVDPVTKVPFSRRRAFGLRGLEL